MKPQTDFQMRDAVFKTLMETYAPNDSTEWWVANLMQRDGKTSFSADVCIGLTTDLFAMVAFTLLADSSRARYERENLDLNVQRLIWNNFSGGTTAAAVAKDVCDIMNIPHPNLDEGSF